MQKIIICVIISVLLLFGIYYIGYHNGHSNGYKNGYDIAYDIGYKDGYQERNLLAEKSSAKVETKIVYKEKPYDGKNDVVVKTEPPKITIDVNGKKQEFEQKSATADLAVKTEAEVKLKIPQKNRWSIGIGTDGKKMAYMLKGPIKIGKVNNNVDFWVAGSEKCKVMGGISVSF